MSKKWILAVGVIALIAFVAIGTLWNYQGFKENAEQGIKDKNPEITFTGDAQKPNAGDGREWQEAKLELTQASVTLEVGAVFQPIDFIKIAQDNYGYSVKEKVNTDQEIPTDKEGKYEIEYILDLGNGNQLSKSMIVEVKNMNEE